MCWALGCEPRVRGSFVGVNPVSARFIPTLGGGVEKCPTPARVGEKLSDMLEKRSDSCFLTLLTD